MTVKKIRRLKPAPLAKSKQSKPVKRTGLSKSDPNYFAKIGRISARRRQMTSEQFSAMAKRSHAPDSARNKKK